MSSSIFKLHIKKQKLGARARFIVSVTHRVVVELF